MRMTKAHRAKMQAGRLAAKNGARKPKGRMTPIKAIRLKCLDCCNRSPNVVKFCTLDGVHSTNCTLWPFRFGKRPESVARGPNAKFINPDQMPDAYVTQEACMALERE